MNGNMKSRRHIKKKRGMVAVIMLLSILGCFTQKVWVNRKISLDEVENKYGKDFFSKGGGLDMYIVDTVYRANMTLLLGKKTLHPFIMVDIEKADIPYRVTERDLIKSPYCYLSIATYGEFFLDELCISPRTPLPLGIDYGDTIVASEYFDFATKWLDEKRWKLYPTINQLEASNNKDLYENFYVVTFNPPTDKAVLCLVKAKLMNRFTGSLVPITDEICIDTSRVLTQDNTSRYEYIEPYEFDNEEVFYKALFPYAEE